jgi:threonine aldolase
VAAARALDFRSDTVTQPTDAMRKAMAEAEVGDDVYGEDPTVNRLEAEAARTVGMEAGLFVPTGTMGNQIAAWVHTGRRGALLAHERSHVAYYEGGAASLVSGAAILTVAGGDGMFRPQDMAPHLDATRDPHFPDVRMVAVENTVQWSGGRCWPLRQLQAVRDAAQGNEAKLHIDGARIFNAAVAQRTTAARLCAGADSVMFCVSKGLSAPVGSLLCGSEEFIEEAHTARKCLGGGMRQAGHLAAAGIVALDTGIERLADDHANARLLAKGLRDLPGVAVDLKSVETNMVMADVSGTGMDATAFIAACRKAGIRIGARGADPVVRFVTHRNVSAADCKLALERVAALLA